MSLTAFIINNIMAKRDIFSILLLPRLKLSAVSPGAGLRFKCTYDYYRCQQRIESRRYSVPICSPHPEPPFCHPAGYPFRERRARDSMW